MAPLRWLAALTLLSACGGYSYLRDGYGTYFGIEVRDGREIPWVRGPWPVIDSSVEADAIIDQLCAPLMGLPAAAPPRGDYGQEYCGVIYSHEGRYHASWPAALETRRPIAVEQERPGEVYVRDGRRGVLTGRVMDKVNGVIQPVPEDSR
ncbi:hypothetical protein [Corallococcus sp. AB018]|uniref:hypothetical protein n=1 Tax=Corallococcus sp. AB018 TaxID=2316715 RepID=UPI000F89A131|nr:hypothetical protein [Corallococcus sp. AB018]